MLLSLEYHVELSNMLQVTRHLLCTSLLRLRGFSVYIKLQVLSSNSSEGENLVSAKMGPDGFKMCREFFSSGRDSRMPTLPLLGLPRVLSTLF